MTSLRAEKETVLDMTSFSVTATPGRLQSTLWTLFLSSLTRPTGLFPSDTMTTVLLSIHFGLFWFDSLIRSFDVGARDIFASSVCLWVCRGRCSFLRYLYCIGYAAMHSLSRIVLDRFAAVGLLSKYEIGLLSTGWIKIKYLSTKSEMCVVQ